MEGRVVMREGGAGNRKEGERKVGRVGKSSGEAKRWESGRLGQGAGRCVEMGRSGGKRNGRGN